MIFILQWRACMADLSVSVFGGFVATSLKWEKENKLYMFNWFYWHTGQTAIVIFEFFSMFFWSSATLTGFWLKHVELHQFK